MRLILIASLLGACSVGAMPPEAREWKPDGAPALKYRWAAPARIDPARKYPLVLFLHGAGERGDDNKAQLTHGVLPILEGAGKLGEPCFLIAPQCPADAWWVPIDRETMRPASPGAPNPLLESVISLVRATLKEHPVDPRRVCVTGISMGGYATWELLRREPDLWAGAAPVCGGGDPSAAPRFHQVPVWAFHGAKDDVVPAATTREMIDALRKAGATPELTIYPNAGHDSWTATYADENVIRWIFARKRG